MTTDRHDDDHRRSTADEMDRQSDRRDPAPTTSDESNTVASLFDRAPANVTVDDVRTALRVVRSGEEE
jgi:hypothetical protein